MKKSGLFAILAAAILLTGCMGIYDNTNVFAVTPEKGLTEASLIQRYGTPSFAGYAENQHIYTFKVRNNKYIVCVGLYDGYDMVVTCEDGMVKEVARVERPKGFALLNPVPWAEGQE